MTRSKYFRTPTSEMAREAIDRLLVRVGPKAERPEPVRRVYPVKLVVRNSTARVRE